MTQGCETVKTGFYLRGHLRDHAQLQQELLDQGRSEWQAELATVATKIAAKVEIRLAGDVPTISAGGWG